MDFRTYWRYWSRTLRAHGQQRDDVRVAVMLGWLIMVCDTKVFQASPLLVQYITEPGMLHLISAAYKSAGPDDPEAYLVVVPGLASWLERARQDQVPIFVVTDEERELIAQGKTVPATRLQMITSMAAHEVRHRRKSKDPSFRIIAPDACTAGMSIFEVAWRNWAARWSHRCRAVIASDLSSVMKENQISNEEFDALVIGTTALNALRSNASLDDIVDVIKLQAP